jgi:diaminopimelate decarboxylase
MDDFIYRDGRLYCEETAIETLLATGVGTPLYVYSRRTLEMHYRRFCKVFEDLNPMMCFSIKTAGNIHLLRVLVESGAGMDVVSGGELFRALQAGTPPERIVYAGVGKTDHEISQALKHGIGWFNVESEQEFENLAELAQRSSVGATAALRINPDVWDARTPEKTTTGKAGTKFGVDIDCAPAFFAKYGGNKHVRLRGLHIHLGSPILAADAYGMAIGRVLRLMDELESNGYCIDILNIGGGIPAEYGETDAAGWEAYGEVIVPALRSFVDRGGQVIMEPGRAISANAGVLLTRVLYVKTSGSQKFVVVDAGMNTLIRPALYDAVHFVWPVHVSPELVPPVRSRRLDMTGLELVDVVGPICETTDYLARSHECPPVKRGETLCVYGAGAYGMVMASQYNAQPRPAEVLIEGTKARLIRRRETYDDLIAHEVDPEWIGL